MAGLGEAVLLHVHRMPKQSSRNHIHSRDPKPCALQGRQQTYLPLRGGSNSLPTKERQGENLAHLETILPELAKLDCLHMSINEIKAVESELIEELDSIRQVDANTGQIIYSHEYRVLENQLALLLQAHDCLSKEAYADNLITLKQKHNSTAQAPNFTKKYSCWSGFLIPFSKCTSVNWEVESS